ncbi:MAG TPA: hypothetical protein VGG41_16750 [Solirubrobacteraceae bacterium]
MIVGTAAGGPARATRRSWLAAPTTALALGGLSLAMVPVSIVLQALIGHSAWSSTGVADGVAGVVSAIAFTTVGTVVARREPQNPMGWLLIAVVLCVEVGTVAPSYAYLDYARQHGTLPLGHVAVVLSAAWEYSFALMPLIVLLFPDGRLGPRWRWPLRAYSVVVLALVAGTVRVAVSAFSLRVPIDGSGNLIGLNHPSGANAWFGPAQSIALAAAATLTFAAVGLQIRRFRRAEGEERQQLKWLATGAATLIVCLAINSATGGGSGLIGNLTFSIGLAALPVSMGVGILRYRLYDIDRLVSRTLAYAILTALLVGTFIGLVALTTNILDLSGRVGVAASTLAAAALFNPLRIRIQRVVDRRFNRARYDAEATVAAFTARYATPSRSMPPVPTCWKRSTARSSRRTHRSGSSSRAPAVAAIMPA